VTYRVALTPRATRELAAFPRNIQRRVARGIDQLAQDPRCPGSVKLQGTDDLYRLHAGRDHVIVYQIEEARVLVLVVRVADRKEAYRNLPKRIIIDRLLNP
jgi:mRNA interferase RelE/StbE